MSKPISSIGVDLGGTWIRLEAVDAAGRRMRSFKAPAPTIPQLPTFLRKNLRAWKTYPRHLIVASRGIWTRSERDRLKRALRSLAHNITVMSDVEAAWHAAFTGERPQGIVVIAGTGSIAFGRDADGCARRAGGWGPLLGDEGSAFWLGKTWLNKQRNGAMPHILKRTRSSPDTVRRIAALAPTVLRQARSGNREAKDLIKEAQRHLADLAKHAARQLHFKKSIPVSWGGTLLGNLDFRKGFLTALRTTGRRFHVTPPGDSPALAIAKMGSHERTHAS